MPDWKIPLSDLDYGAEESAAVERVLRSKWLSMGPETQAFEQEFAALTGAKHALAVSNGTAALHLALLALGIGPGDEVIQPAVNFVASANMTRAVAATPVFADIVGLDEPVLDPGEVEKRITPRTKAVIVMHYGGYLSHVPEMVELCRERGLPLIEDACHAVGARCHDSGGRAPHGQGAGNLGDIACFSFFSNKNLATGEGGMITTSREDLRDKVRLLRSHGMSTLTWDRHRGHAATYDVLAHGYNYRMDDLRSALGREQLRKLGRNNQRRRELTHSYWTTLASLETRGWILPFKQALAADPTAAARTACHLLPVVAPDGETRWRCASALKEVGIQTSLHYPFIPTFSGFAADTVAEGLPVSREFCERIITVPLYPTMTPAQLCLVCQALMSAAAN